MHVYLDNLNSVCIYLDTEIEQLVLTILTVLLIDPYKKLQIKRFQKQKFGCKFKIESHLSR